MKNRKSGVTGKALSRPLLALAAALLTLQPAHAQQPPNTAVNAGVVELSRGDVPVTVPLSGQAAASRSATIRPLVDGVITEIAYRPGQPIVKGTLLFQVDPRSYEAALASAKATLQSAEAALPAAKSALDRAERLVGSSVTQETLESARVTHAQAEATVAEAQASVLTAEINLARAQITSPIDGIPAVADVSVGDLVTSGQSDALTTITSLDPIYVDLNEASARMLQLRARMESGEMKPGDRIKVRITLENGQVFNGEGRLDSIGSVVSTTTGTRKVRFEFANAERRILPGMFVRAEMTLGTSQAILVPQLAATLQADGTLKIFTLGDDNTAQEAIVSSIGSTDNAWIVASGLEDGTRLIVDNLDRISNGVTINPVAVTISDTGVISDSQGGN